MNRFSVAAAMPRWLDGTMWLVALYDSAGHQLANSEKAKAKAIGCGTVTAPTVQWPPAGHRKNAMAAGMLSTTPSSGKPSCQRWSRCTSLSHSRPLSSEPATEPMPLVTPNTRPAWAIDMPWVRTRKLGVHTA